MKTLNKTLLLLASAFTLTGCPGSGDRLRADEAAAVSKVGDNICFNVPDPADYQPSLIAINPRGTPPQALSVTDSPHLTLNAGKLCIPPDFYRFKNEQQYIVQYILAVPGDKKAPRSVVTGIELSAGQVHNIPLTDSETTR